MACLGPSTQSTQTWAALSDFAFGTVGGKTTFAAVDNNTSSVEVWTLN